MQPHCHGQRPRVAVADSGFASGPSGPSRRRCGDPDLLTGRVTLRPHALIDLCAVIAASCTVATSAQARRRFLERGGVHLNAGARVESSARPFEPLRDHGRR